MKRYSTLSVKFLPATNNLPARLAATINATGYRLVYAYDYTSANPELETAKKHAKLEGFRVVGIAFDANPNTSTYLIDD